MEVAIAYIRVSDPRQVIDGNSLATQEQQVRDYAVSKRYELLRVFVEKGESAKSDERTVLQEMLAFCQKHVGKIQALIFPKIDRFARYLPDYISLKAQLTRLGIRVDSVGEPIENNPAGRLMEHMLASFAQFDNEIRAERSRGGAVTAAREGRYVSRPPFGYQRTRVSGKVTIEPHPDQAQVVREIFEQLASGSNLTYVRRWLESKGICFARSYVHKLVRNKVFIGQIERFGEINKGTPPFVPLISKSQFQAAQTAIRPRSLPRTYNRDNPDFPLRGTLRCQCGRLLMGGWSQGRSRRYAHYRCPNCPRVNHRRDLVHRAFCLQLRAVSLNPNLVAQFRNFILEQSELIKMDAKNQSDRLRERVHALQDLRRTIARKVAIGVLPDDLAKEQLEESASELEQAQRQLARFGSGNDNMDRVMEFAETFFAEIDDRWRNGSIQPQKKLQRFVFPKGLTIDRDGNLRTAEKERNTGLDVLVRAELSSIVHRGDESSNPVRSTKQKREDSRTLAEISRIFKEVFYEFGSDPVNDLSGNTK